MLSSVPAGSGTSSSSSTTRAVNSAAASKSEAAAEAEVHLAVGRLLGDGDRRHAEHEPLERGRDGARVGDVVAEVRAVVDARDDQVGPEALDQAERREAHAVDGRAVGREADRAVLERRLLHPQRAPRRDHARHRRAVAVRRDRHELDAVDARRSARRSAWRPSASMPSSLVRSTCMRLLHPTKRSVSTPRVPTPLHMPDVKHA